MGTIRKVAAWSPTLLLGVLIAFAVSQGLGIESVVVLALLLVQALVLVAPHVSQWVGRKIAERSS